MQTPNRLGGITIWVTVYLILKYCKVQGRDRWWRGEMREKSWWDWRGCSDSCGGDECSTERWEWAVAGCWQSWWARVRNSKHMETGRKQEDAKPRQQEELNRWEAAYLRCSSEWADQRQVRRGNHPQSSAGAEERSASLCPHTPTHTNPKTRTATI